MRRLFTHRLCLLFGGLFLATLVGLVLCVGGGALMDYLNYGHTHNPRAVIWELPLTLLVLVGSGMVVFVPAIAIVAVIIASFKYQALGASSRLAAFLVGAASLPGTLFVWKIAFPTEGYEIIAFFAGLFLASTSGWSEQRRAMRRADAERLALANDHT